MEKIWSIFFELIKTARLVQTAYSYIIPCSYIWNKDKYKAHDLTL
jgi:hypothetical protein